MKWLWLIPALFLLLLLVVLIVGLFQPVRHSVTRFLHLHQKAEAVFALLDHGADLPNWSSIIIKAERLPDQDGKPVARYTLSWGGRQMIVTQLEHAAPTRLVFRMAKEEGPVLGTWTYEITPETNGCLVALTEEGELKNPIFRTMARMRGLDANITQTLRDVAKKFGESAEVRADR